MADSRLTIRTESKAKALELPIHSLGLSGSSLAGGTNAVAPGAAPLQESYSLDPWGNMQQSGNFSFTQAFTASNQISGFSYDAAGDLLNDTMNTYTYDNEGMLTSSGGAQYVCDALQQRVEKTGGSNAGEVGYAMKGTDRSRMLGAVVGKAMANLESGKGVIEVLVTLQ